jgi:hypothetical protein
LEPVLEVGIGCNLLSVPEAGIVGALPWEQILLAQRCYQPLQQTSQQDKQKLLKPRKILTSSQ